MTKYYMHLNNKNHLWWRIFGALMAVIFIIIPVGQSLASDYVSNFKRIPAVQNRAPQAAVWKRTPTVIVCEYAPVTKSDVDKAVQFWKDLGYRFFTTQYHYDPLNKCKSTAPIGYIIVRLIHQDIRMDEDSLAQTHFFVNNDRNEVEWAIIYMKSDIRETVLEHEMGHSLGFLHFNKINHLMNSKWTQGGWDTEGLAKTR